MVFIFLTLFDLLQCPVMLMTNSRNKVFAVKLLKQAYRYHKLRKVFSNFIVDILLYSLNIMSD